MSSRILIIAACFLTVAVHGVSKKSAGQLTSQATVKAMEKVFARSQKTHEMSMATIMKSMSPKQAWHVLEKNNLTTPSLIEMNSQLHGQQANLRKTPPKGYAGIEGARKMLNDMIYKAMEKYDVEITECTEFYYEQCNAMEMCRGQISQSNYEASNSRKLILDAQSDINICEVEIPETKAERQKHINKCDNELKTMRARQAVIEADIEVMTVILKMTDCKASSFISMKKLSVLHCQDPCTKQSFVTFNHNDLKQKVSQLQSSTSRKLMKDTFADLFQGIEGLQGVEFLQVASKLDRDGNKTAFNNPPVPRTEVPEDPCNDEDAGAPSAADKRQAKCTISGSPQCYKLQERFLLIQSGIKDERDALLEDINSMEEHCKETKETLEAQIQACEDVISASQTKLAFATEKESVAGERARLTETKHKRLNGDLKERMKKCSETYISSETEICALKKIRGELYKMKGSGHSPFFQDCEVSKWTPEKCSQDCKRVNEPDGVQKLTREVVAKEEGGAKCLPFFEERKCNLQPCPVDCIVGSWGGWSKCSAECGGGVQQRLKEVKQASRHGGNQCGETSQTRSCNNQACEVDCELSEWSKWSWCSKDCDGGTRHRFKHIKASPEGAGSCPGLWSPKRLQYKSCNMQRCPPLKCKKELDIVFLIDGSGSLGSAGWKAEIKAAQTFVDAFTVTGAKAQMAVILYSGPRTWGGVWKCWARNTAANMETDCKIKTVTTFSTDMAAVKKSITDLKWPQGSTLTSLALMRAKAEFSLGRKDAQSVVVVVTDGRPLSYWKTRAASRSVRKAARLVWVPVTRYAPLRWIKSWATRRWQENVVRVRDFSALEKPDVVNHVVANICPTHGR